MHHNQEWLGTVWVMCHQKRRQFDGEDVRLMTHLGSLASALFAKARAQGTKKMGTRDVDVSARSTRIVGAA
jgi:GAF domain-containing protein